MTEKAQEPPTVDPIPPSIPTAGEHGFDWTQIYGFDPYENMPGTPKSGTGSEEGEEAPRQPQPETPTTPPPPYSPLTPPQPFDEDESDDAIFTDAPSLEPNDVQPSDVEMSDAPPLIHSDDEDVEMTDEDEDLDEDMEMVDAPSVKVYVEDTEMTDWSPEQRVPVPSAKIPAPGLSYSLPIGVYATRRRGW